jgi:hypothetical protein
MVDMNKLAMEFGSAFVKDVHDLVINYTDKVGFDLDTTGRKRHIAMMVQQAQAAYGNVNIAVWNMHVPVDEMFHNVIESGIVKMGNGGGFRVVVFRGGGYLRNNGARGLDNWCCVGNQSQNDNTISFGPL